MEFFEDKRQAGASAFSKPLKLFTGSAGVPPAVLEYHSGRVDRFNRVLSEVVA